MVSMDGYLTLATKPSQCDEKREKGEETTDGWSSLLTKRKSSNTTTKASRRAQRPPRLWGRRKRLGKS